ncbi:MAG: penicillin-binding protein 2 [Parcubacteria group bacterium]|jgi:penicillin-binding protein 2
MRLQKISKYRNEIEDAVLTASEKEIARMSFDFDRRWLTIFWIVIAGSLITLTSRVFYLSVVKGDYYAFVASGNSVQSVPIIAPRGEIFDFYGTLLANNMPSRSIVVDPKLLPHDEEMQRNIVARLAQILAINESDVAEAFDMARASGSETVVKENITHEQSLDFKAQESELSGVRIQQFAIRHYADGEKFAHIIGYEGLIKKEEHEEHPDYLLIDRIGKTGVEYYYEKDLHGTHGAQQMLVDSRGNVVKDLVDVAPVAGGDLYLNIDAELQKFLFDRLSKELERAKTKRATAVVIDPRDGAVRAIVSLPSYDNNVFAQGIDHDTYNNWITDENRPLFNRAIGGAYAPGSTVKPIMAAAVLAEHIVSPDYQIESRGGLQIGSFFFGDWRAHGFTDLRRAIAVSSDVYFYTVGGGNGDVVGLGIERMKEYMTKFGYGEKTGIDLSGEVSGFYPDKKWKEDTLGERWYVGNTYHAAIGQGFVTATALQVANAIAAIANGGTLYEPHVVSHIVHKTTDTTTTIEPKIIRDHLGDPQDIKIIQEGMRQTVTDGTATMLKNLNVAIAGKTGTAQFGNGDSVHSWFVSYAPYDHPEMVLAIMVEGQTGELSSTTVPVARDVYMWQYGGRDMSVFDAKAKETSVSAPPEEVPIRD